MTSLTAGALAEDVPQAAAGFRSRGGQPPAADLSEANLSGADLTGCHVFGVSAWRLRLSEGTKRKNLVITRRDEPAITVDNIEVAQFIYLLLHNEKIRDAIDTIGKKGCCSGGSLKAPPS